MPQNYPKKLGTGLVILSTGFVLGVVYSNWAYDYHLLWEQETSKEFFKLAAVHYKTRALQPNFLHHVLHFVLLLGFGGLFIKLYKPEESNVFFDGGSLVLFLLAVIFYLTNLRPAANSVIENQWNDISEELGLQLIAASQVLIVLMFMGVLSLQAGQWWAERDTYRQLAKANKVKAAKADPPAAVENPALEAAEQAAATGARTAKSPSKRRV